MSDHTNDLMSVLPSAQFLLTVGGILLLGLFTSTLAERTFLPRVTLLLVFGALIGPEGLNLIPTLFTDRFEVIADMTLLMVGFLLGGKLTVDSLKSYGAEVFLISISAAVITTLLVSVSLYAIGVSASIAILLGCIASATAPAAILDVVAESRLNNKFTSVLLSIVALDDIWALMLFAIGLAVVGNLNGQSSDQFFLWVALRDIGGAIALGVVLGWPAAYLTGRIRAGQPMLLEALGIVFLCGGLAIWLDVSYLIAAMVMGALIVNLAQHHDYAFHEIEGVEATFMIIFFVLAGASLEFQSLQDLGLIGGAYMISRIVGKVIGARIGGELAKSDSVSKTWMGAALLPQAGVAVGMALVATHHYPEYRQILLSIVISSTVLFEIIGPIFTRMALKKTC